MGKAKKIQILKYKCCGNTFAACTVPECYTDEDWTSELAKYVTAGNTDVEIVDNNTGLRFTKCECIEVGDQLTLEF